MNDVRVPRWPWWMAPARLIGQYRPALLATASADAAAMEKLPRVFVAVGLPLAVVLLAVFVNLLHATTVAEHPSIHIDWLRFQIDDVFTEAPAFILAALAIGIFSPALGVLLVVVFGVLDVAAAAVQPYEFQPLPGALAARLVATWLLWLLVVEIPVLGRMLVSTFPAVARNRVTTAAASGFVIGGFTLLWAAGAAILVRPIFEWSSLQSGGRLEAYVPMQTGGIVFAVAAAVLAAAVAFSRRPGGMFQYAASIESARSQDKPKVPAAAMIGRVIAAALLTIGLGGMITEPLDAVVLFGALVASGPLARLIAARIPLGAVIDRVPSTLRFAIAIPLVYGVSFLLIDAELLKSVSEFFPVIAVFAVGLLLLEIATAQRSVRADAAVPPVGVVGIGALVLTTLVAVSAVAPEAVLADNGTSLQDLWAAFDQAVFAGMATPVLVWAANKARLPPKPPPRPDVTWDEPPPRPHDYQPPPPNPEPELPPAVEAIRQRLKG